MRRQQEQWSGVTIRRADNGFVVTPNLEPGFASGETYVANDYEHLTAILKDILGPVEMYPDDFYFGDDLFITGDETF